VAALLPGVRRHRSGSDVDGLYKDGPTRIRCRTQRQQNISYSGELDRVGPIQKRVCSPVSRS
jgi:hypothetical protein